MLSISTVPSVNAWAFPHGKSLQRCDNNFSNSDNLSFVGELPPELNPLKKAYTRHKNRVVIGYNTFLFLSAYILLQIHENQNKWR
jgi:hypothetical protein